MPALLDRTRFETWSKAESKDFTRVRATVQKILKERTLEPLPSDVTAKINNVLSEATKRDIEQQDTNIVDTKRVQKMWNQDLSCPDKVLLGSSYYVRDLLLHILRQRFWRVFLQYSLGFLSRDLIDLFLSSLYPGYL